MNICNVSGDGNKAGQVPVSDSADIFRPPIGVTTPQFSTAASSLTAQHPTVSASVRTSTELLPPAAAIVNAASPMASIKSLPDSSGDNNKLVTIGSVSSVGLSLASQTSSSLALQSQAVVTFTSSITGVTQAGIVSSCSALPISFQSTHEVPHSMNTTVGNIVPLSVSVGITAVSSVSSVSVPTAGTFSSLTSFAGTGGFKPVFGIVSQPSSALNTVQQQSSVQTVSTTSTATQLPHTQPTVSVSSNPVSLGGFGNQPSFSFSASTSNQSAVTSSAVVSLQSKSNAAVTLPSSTQSASSAFGVSFKAAVAAAFPGSDNQNSSKDQDTSFQFGSFPVQPMFNSSTTSSSSSASSTTVFAPSVVPFGNSQQPSFQPVFGNSASQGAASSFGSFVTNSAAPTFSSQPVTTVATQASSSNMFQTSGNQMTSTSVAGFTGISSTANPFGSSAFQPGSAIFSSSVSKSDGQPTLSSFGSFTAGGPFASSTAASGSSVFGSSVPKADPQTTVNSFGAFPGVAANVPAFGSSTLQTGSNIFGSGLVPASISQSGSGSFGTFAPPAFGNASTPQVSTVFGGGSAPVFNGMPSTTWAPQSSLPNGFHKSAASPFTFSGKTDQTPSGTASPFSFGQSTNTVNVNNFPMPTSVPTFGSAAPAVPSFTFGKRLVCRSKYI